MGWAEVWCGTDSSASRVSRVCPCRSGAGWSGLWCMPVSVRDRHQWSAVLEPWVSGSAVPGTQPCPSHGPLLLLLAQPKACLVLSEHAWALCPQGLH